MNTTSVNVKVTHQGKVIEKPTFAFKAADGRLIVDANFITKMANQLGYHPRVVKVSISEDTFDEAA